MIDALIELYKSNRGLILALAVLILGYTLRKGANPAPVAAPAAAPIEAQKVQAKSEPVKEETKKQPSQSKPAKKSAAAAVPLAVDFTSISTSSALPEPAAATTRVKRMPKKFTAKASVAAERKLRQLQGPGGPVASVDSPVYVFYSTLTGTSQRMAEKLVADLTPVLATPPKLLNLDYVDDLEPYFVAPEKSTNPPVYLIVVPSYEIESPLDYFIELLKETYNDFRIDSRPLAALAGFSVFGIGDRESWPEKNRYCYQAALVDKWMSKLGARRVFPLGTGCVKTDLEDSLLTWRTHLSESLRDPVPVMEPESIVDSDDESEDETSDNSDGSGGSSSTLVDVEDIGGSIAATSEARKGASSSTNVKTKEMVGKDSPTYNALTKQGYTVVGSHSGVKICRWTKSALRGRGSCYKFSFYGIKSHLCMETTPSLSCSNKCVFCWRHGTNPVGTTWRWQVDPPEKIFEGAKAGHYKKIKQMRGVPGVVADRFTEAFTVKHCALSLVGEPIFYPHINEFVGLLHGEHISSFLVCNAQHPDELERLGRVTQLYVSIDASNKEDLHRIDRPLHRDYWERFQKCLSILKTKKSQRTVFRLTLVGGFNMEDACDEYAELIEKGEPCFVEIKGVTYCGTSKGSSLTMKNVPFYEEVKLFVETLNRALAKRGLEYGIAAEHAHSCCILMAQNRFKIDGVWHTVIDYKRFFELLESGADFGPMDYIAPTAEWAHYGANEGGFSPDDVRHRRGKVVEVAA
ncbi:similar to Saccharomyces cerevisiae YPL207W TYW1 Protein required for the synthesis of wybutosine [Geotrichum candidum]|uniref:S-adenosyl-L-methionine-dependent tRNA 4-demethylwyosine synthase n=1 Tax=Geotrichum candidum TaxID=1173061 RepID=A0A0J9XJY0_GEOCN|nr:similar to Saccharomyces cerevisiae YPL207W TYW1 Protein required for the synthesis of wybutosine [Geotrichum candidum]